MFITITETMWEPGLALLRTAGPTLYDPDLHRNPGRLVADLADARALVVRNSTRVTAELLAAAPVLQVVGRLGAGLDNVDLQACRRRGVAVVYAPGANAVSVAEHTLALILALARRLCPAHAAAREGRWEREALAGTELAGKTLGILGFGSIGRLVAERARALGMAIAVHHPRLSPADPDLTRLEARLVSLADLLRQADYLTLHLPLADGTRGILGEAELQSMKPGACLINTARGGLVDEDALARALQHGPLTGAALDVRSQEPPAPNDPLAPLPQVLLTPHVAGLTKEAQARTCLMVAEDVLRVLREAPPLHPAG